MPSSSPTASEKAKLKKGLTPEGRQVLSILQTEYQMTQDAALKLMRDGGKLLAVAIMMRRK